MEAMTKVSPIKLSTAIRLGAMLKPQGFTEFVDELGRTCAIGAAADAIGKLSQIETGAESECEFWPVLNVWANYPGGQISMSVWSIVTNLNDEEHWSRERIADFVEGIERAQESQGAAPVETAATV